MANPDRTVLTESDITDPGPLRTALNNAGGSGAPVAWGDVTGKPSNFPPSTHTHVMSSVTGLTEQISGEVDSTPFGPGEAVSTGDAISEAFRFGVFAVDTALSVGESVEGKAPIDHAHPVVPDSVQVLTNPTEIPSGGSGRVDLVFTEPTTVHFATPGRTDVAVSIEGYEHVTWEGVVVRGTPDASGVVWASALWREVDSSWYLLVEQDPAQAGGGGLQTITYPGPTRRLDVESDESGEAVRDADGLSVPIEVDIPVGSLQAHQDVVVPVERDWGGVRQRSLQPVSSGLSASVSLQHLKTDSPSVAAPQMMQNGAALIAQIGVKGPDVRIFGSFWAARNTGLESSALIQMGTADILPGHAETGEGQITWMSQYDVLADFTLPGGGRFAAYLIAIPDPAVDGAGIYMYAGRIDGGGESVPGPVVLPENPDEPSGLWLSHFDFTIDRSGRWRDLS